MHSCTSVVYKTTFKGVDFRDNAMEIRFGKLNLKYENKVAVLINGSVMKVNSYEFNYANNAPQQRTAFKYILNIII